MEGRDPGRYIGHMLILLLMFAITPAELRANDGVATVREALPAAETCIIHIRDWHLVPKDAFAADTELEGRELDEAYAEHILAVKAVQAAQRPILQDAKEVYSEGLAKTDMPIFEAIIRLMRKKPQEDRLMKMGVVAQLLVEEKLVVTTGGKRILREGEFRSKMARSKSTRKSRSGVRMPSSRTC
jgi:hypothetical protein